MSRLIKYVLLALGLVLVLSIGAAIAVVALVDPDDYRDAIGEAVEAQTGRQLAIDGKLSLSLLPCCGIDVGASRLSNPPGFPEGDFAAFEQAGLRIQVWPLLTRQELIVGSVSIEGLSLSLIERNASSNNWTFETSETAVETEPSGDSSGDEPLPQLSIDEILIRDARLSYDNLATGQRIAVNELRFETGPVVPGDPIRFDLELAGRDDVEDIEGTLELGGVGLLDLDAQTLTLTDVSGGLEVEELATIRPLTLGVVTYGLETGNVRIEPSTALINYQGINANVSAAAEVTGEQLSGSGRIEVQAFSPRKLLTAQGIEVITTDPDVLSNAGANLEFVLSPDAISIRELTAVLDDTRITGTAGVVDFDAPAVTVQLNLDEIDLDRYLAPADDAAVGSPTSADAASSDDLPLEALRELNVRGDLGIARLRVVGLTLSEFSASLKARKGDIRLDPLRLALYGGTLTGDLRLDAAGDVAKLAVKQSLQSVNAAALLGDLADTTELKGTLNGDIALSSSAATQSALIDGLGGQFDGRLDDGAYQGVDLWHEISVARALIRRKSPPRAPASPQTLINEMSVNGTIAGETVNFDRLIAEIPFLRLSGRGSIDTAAQSLQLKFDGNVLEAPELENGEVLSDLKGLTIPLTITGPIDSPKVGVDLKNLTKSVAEEKIREKLLEELGDDEPAKEGEKESSGDVLKRGLRDLLKR